MVVPANWLCSKGAVLVHEHMGSQEHVAVECADTTMPSAYVDRSLLIAEAFGYQDWQDRGQASHRHYRIDHWVYRGSNQFQEPCDGQ